MERPLENSAQPASVSLAKPPAQGQGNSTARAVAEALFRHQVALLWTMGSVAAATLLYILLVPRTYQSEMNILVRNARPDYQLSPERSNGSTPLPDVTEEKINSEIEVLRSKDVADTVVDANWTATPIAQRTQAEIKAHEKSVIYYNRHLTIESMRKSNVIHVTYTGTSPHQATETVEHLLDAFLAKQREIERSTGASTFFASEAQRYKAQLDEAQQQLATYQQRNQMVSLPDKESTLQIQISQLEDQIRATQVAITEASSRISAGQGQLRSMPSRMSTSERSIPNTYTVEQLTTLLANLQNQRTAALVKFLPTDRMVLQLNKQIADTSAALRAATDAKAMENTTDVNPVYQQVRSSVAQSSTEVRALTGRLANQNEQLARLKQSLSNVEGSTVDYSTLQSRVTELQGNYQLYSQKRNEAEIADAMDKQNLVNVAVAERPTFSAKPFRPEPLIDLSLGGFTAIFLAACVVFFAEMGRDTVGAPWELEALTRVPVLATVPWTEGTMSRVLSGFRSRPAASRGPRPDRNPRYDPSGPSRPTYTPDNSGSPAWSGNHATAAPAGFLPPKPPFAYDPSASQPLEAPVTAAAAWFAKVKSESGAHAVATRLAASDESPAPIVASAPQAVPQQTVVASLQPVVRSQPPVQPQPLAQPQTTHRAAPIAAPVARVASPFLPAPVAYVAAVAEPKPRVQTNAALPQPFLPHTGAGFAAAPTLASVNPQPSTASMALPEFNNESRQESAMLDFLKSRPTSLNLKSDESKEPTETRRPIETKNPSKSSDLREAKPQPVAAVAAAEVRDPVARLLSPQRPSSQMRRVGFATVSPLAEQVSAIHSAMHAARKAAPAASEPELEGSHGEPRAYPQSPHRSTVFADLERAAAELALLTRSAGEETRSRPKFFADDPVPVEKPVAVPMVEEPAELAVLANSQAEPIHRPSSSRLAAIRDEVQGNKPRLSPSQRAMRARAEAARDRNGRAAYVTYTVDPRDATMRDKL